MQRPLVLLVAAGRAESEARHAVASASDGDSVVRGRCRGASDDGSPSSSQNICARVPSGSRAPGSPASSAASRRSASPRRGCPTGRRRRGGRCRRAPARRGSARRRRRPPPAAHEPPGADAAAGGRSSSDASSPTSARRSAVYSAREQRVERDVGDAGRRRRPHGRRTRAWRTRRRCGRTRRLRELREVEARRAGRAAAGTPGPGPRVRVLCTVRPRKSSVAGSSKRRLPATPGRGRSGRPPFARGEAVDRLGDEALVEGAGAPRSRPRAGRRRLRRRPSVRRGQRRVAEPRARARGGGR